MMTIGVTLELPSPWREELQDVRLSTGDPLGATIPPHITVLGPTQVPHEQVEQVGEHLLAAARATRPFEIELRGTGTFRPVSPVVFVQVRRGISSCEQLERRVRSGLLHRDTAFGYHPHVTIAHGVDEDQLDRVYDELADFHARFTVERMDLAVLGSDEAWRPVRTYPFEG